MSYIGLDMGVCMLSEVDKDGFIGIQVDAHGDDAGVETYEAHFPLGFYARPLDPEKDANGEALPAGSSTVLFGIEGGQGHAWPMGDPRAIQKLPKGAKKKGGAVFYSPASGGFAMWEGKDPKGVRREGSFSVAVKYGEKSALFAVDVSTPGKEVIKLTHGDGHGIELRSDGSVFMIDKSGASWLQIKGDQIVMNGDTQAQGSLSVGDAAAAQPVVSLPGLLAYLSVLETALKGAVSPIIVPPAAGMKDLLGTKTLTAS